LVEEKKAMQGESGKGESEKYGETGAELGRSRGKARMFFGREGGGVGRGDGWWRLGGEVAFCFD
jgi:hypothetical protein